jgi:hypothetical protein
VATGLMECRMQSAECRSENSPRARGRMASTMALLV